MYKAFIICQILCKSSDTALSRTGSDFALTDCGQEGILALKMRKQRGHVYLTQIFTEWREVGCD